MVNTIDKETVAKLPLETANDSIQHIHIITTPQEVKDAIQAIAQSNIVGFDTETKPSFKKGEGNKTSLLQISTHHEAFLFRLNILGEIPKALQDLLENPNILKIGLSLKDDFNNLNQQTKINFQGFIDLQEVVPSYNIKERSLQKIYAILLKKRISKKQRLSNWEAPNLSKAQQSYAAIDAWACLRIYTHLTQNKQ